MNAIRNDIEDVDAQVEKIRKKIRSAAQDDPMLKNNEHGSGMNLDTFEKRLDQALAICEDASRTRGKTDAAPKK